MVQTTTLTDLYKECHSRYKYRDGKLYYSWAANKRVFAGEEVGYVNNTGYLSVSIGTKSYLVHRLIFLMHHRYLPDLIDHIDQDKLNNRIENLREFSKTLNVFNSKMFSHNKSGYRGVSWHEGGKMWTAQIKVKGKKKHLGSFNCPKKASEAYEKARPKF